MSFEARYNPRVSVIIPVYNNEAYVAETLNSLKEQTFKDFEALCVDDGSTDGSARIIQEFEAADHRFHYIFQQNSGAGPARNNGIRNANGEYISFLDGDDLYNPNFLDKMVEALDKTQADVCVCERDTFNSKDGRIINKGRRYNKYTEGRIYPTQELVDGYFELMTVFCWDKMFRHSFLQKQPYTFQNLQHCNDVAFVCSTMAAAQTVCFIKESLVRYRMGTGVSTQDKAVNHPLCALEAFGRARENIYLLKEEDVAWQKTIDSRCAEAFFNTFQKNAKNDETCKEVYDAFKNQYESEWHFSEKPLHYFENMLLRLKMWCYRRTSYDAMRRIYLKLHSERGKKKNSFNLVKPYAEMVIASVLRR